MALPEAAVSARAARSVSSMNASSDGVTLNPAIASLWPERASSSRSQTPPK